MSTGSLFERAFLGPMTKLAKQRHLLAVRDGMVSTIPLTIVGSLFLIILNLPLPAAWKTGAFFDLIAQNAADIAIPFRITTGLIAIYATYNIGYSLAKSYELDGKSGGSLGLMAFFMTTMPQIADGVGFVIPMSRLGGAGIFSGIFTAILSVEIYRFFVKNNLVIKMPEGVPESVAKSFSALFPSFAIMSVMFLIVVIAKLDVQELFTKLFDPVKNVVDTPVGAVVIVFLTGLLWAVGIHGGSIMGAIARPMWIEMLTENGDAVLAGSSTIPNITPEPFFQWFVWIGGAGGTLSLVILLLFARSRYLKDLGKVTFIPALFNINEPVVFGLPIMLNPFFFVPFIFGPVIITILSYFVVSAGWVGAPYLLAPWTFPGPFGAIVATGDPKAAILVLVNIAILILIYLPFMKAYDKKMYQEELEAGKE